MMHTPKPWIFDYSQGKLEVVSEHDSRAMAKWRADHPNVKSFSGVTVATFGLQFNGSGAEHGPHLLVDADEVVSNAVMTAAAPDLLDALRKLADAAEEREHCAGDQCRWLEVQANLRAAAVEAREAIRKATAIPLDNYPINQFYARFAEIKNKVKS